MALDYQFQSSAVKSPTAPLSPRPLARAVQTAAIGAFCNSRTSRLFPQHARFRPFVSIPAPPSTRLDGSCDPSPSGLHGAWHQMGAGSVRPCRLPIVWTSIVLPSWDIATACSASCPRPTTRSKRPCCEPGAISTVSRDAPHCAPGSITSLPGSVWMPLPSARAKALSLGARSPWTSDRTAPPRIHWRLVPARPGSSRFPMPSFCPKTVSPSSSSPSGRASASPSSRRCSACLLGSAQSCFWWRSPLRAPGGAARGPHRCLTPVDFLRSRR